MRRWIRTISWVICPRASIETGDMRATRRIGRSLINHPNWAGRRSPERRGAAGRLAFLFVAEPLPTHLADDANWWSSSASREPWRCQELPTMATMPFRRVTNVPNSFATHQTRVTVYISPGMHRAEGEGGRLVFLKITMPRGSE